MQLDKSVVIHLRSFAEIEKEMRRIETLLAQNGENNLRKADVAAYSLLLMLAEEMLSVGERPIKEIASLPGYRNQLYFFFSLP